MTSGSLRNFYRDEINDDENENDNATNKINNNKTITIKSFEYKTKIIGRTSDDNNTLNTEIVIPLKYFSNFWRFLNLLMINCEIELDFSWSQICIISEISITLEVRGDNRVDATERTGATFQTNNAIHYVPVVPQSINDNIKFIENIKKGYKRTNSWNKYKSEITTEKKHTNLDDLIDPTCRNINRLFVLSFKNGNDDPTSDSFDECFMPLIEIKDFNLLINNKPFFDQPVKKKQEA